MHRPVLLLASAAIIAPGAAQAAAPAAPPRILAAPSGTVSEKTPLTFRIRAAAGDQAEGRWAVLLTSGNTGAVELAPDPSDPAVYTRTVRLGNARIYAAERSDETKDFAAPETTGRIFPGTVRWRAVFFPAATRSVTGDPRTDTTRERFAFKATFDRRSVVRAPSLPRTGARRIVPNGTLGGIALGDSRGRVVARWGAPFLSDWTLFDRTEVWSRGTVVDGRARPRGDSAAVEYDQDRVALMAFYRPRTDPGGLGRHKTAKGIALGSTVGAVRRAYPRVQEEEDEEDGTLSMFLYGRDGAETVFGFDRSGRLDTILMRDPI